MIAKDFDSAAALAKYVTDQSIAQAKIVKITFVNGRWWLFYFSP